MPQEKGKSIMPSIYPYQEVLKQVQFLLPDEQHQLLHIAEEAAQLRASYNICTPDVIQMASAIKAAAPFFLTNDGHLPSLPNLQVLTLNKLNCL